MSLPNHNDRHCVPAMFSTVVSKREIFESEFSETSPTRHTRTSVPPPVLIEIPGKFCCDIEKMCRPLQRSVSAPLASDLNNSNLNTDCLEHPRKPALFRRLAGVWNAERPPSASSFCLEGQSSSTSHTDELRAQPSFDEIKRKWRGQQIAAQKKVEASNRASWCGWLLQRRGALDILHRQH